jgi:hypothetical protein
MVTPFKCKNICNYTPCFLVQAVFSVFCHGLFYNTLIIKGYTASSGSMIDDLESIWKEAAVLHLIFYFSSCLEVQK